jgi:hypothetical protein
LLQGVVYNFNNEVMHTDYIYDIMVALEEYSRKGENICGENIKALP